MFRLAAVLLCSVALSGCDSGAGAEYRQLVSRIHERNRLEDAAFARLRFELVPDEIFPSQNFKIVLRDQLGRKWLFKAGRSSGSAGAVAVYRAFTAFGLDTPEIHETTLKINGVDVPGSAQRLVKNAGNLSRIEFHELSPAALEYMAKTHLLGWLLCNHQVHPGQFLVMAGETGGPQGLLKIDNSIDWYLFGHDALSIDYRTPMLWSTADVGYGRFWRDYLMKSFPVSREELADVSLVYDIARSRSFELDLRKLHDWADFIADFPDDEYRSYVQPGMEHSPELMGNTAIGGQWMNAPDVMHDASPKKFLDGFLRRKHELSADAGKFYKELARLRGDSVDLSRPASHSAVIAEVTAKIDAGIRAEEADLRALSASPATPVRAISAPVSFNAHKVISSFGLVRLLRSDKDRAAAVEEELRKLSALEAAASDRQERFAIHTAVENIRQFTAKIRAAKDAAALWKNTLNANYFFVPGKLTAVKD